MQQTTAFLINQFYCLFRGDLLCLLPEEGVPFRKGAQVMDVPLECCPGMSAFRWLSRAGPALPAWQCLSNGRCRVCGWVWVCKGPSVIVPCCSQQSLWLGDWSLEEQAAELQSSITPAGLAALELLLGVILLSACSCWLWKHKRNVVCAHCIVLSQRQLGNIYIIKYGFWNSL